jgi:hypothetical protein
MLVFYLTLVVISYRSFGTIYQTHPQGLYVNPERIGSIGCPEMSVRNYHYSLFNNPEECSCQLLCGGSLKSRTYSLWFDFWNSKIIFATSLKICYSFEIPKHARSELLKFVCDLQLLGMQMVKCLYTYRVGHKDLPHFEGELCGL